MKELILKKGGVLIQEHKDGDRNYSDLASECLFDVCTLGENVTLADVFFLINRNLDKLSPILGNWCEEYVKEGLKIHPIDRESEIEFLELYWYLETDEYTKGKPSLGGLNFPRFHGIGFLHEEDFYDKWKTLMYEKGTRTNYAVELTPTYELARLPLKLSTELVLSKDWKTEQTYHNPDFTLGHILYGIMWELSFCGPPAKRDDTRVALVEAAKGITESFDLDDLDS
jgi:hypothetical protein